jgi:HEAT repeat protein
MSDPMREVYEQLMDRHRQIRAVGPKSPEWFQLEADLEARGIDTTDFGLFSSVATVVFDYEAAAPILIEWLPRVTDPSLKETIARSLTGIKTDRADAARAIVAEFRVAPTADEFGAKWAYANALATIADAEIADDLLELIADRRQGRSRQMLCDALKRTGDPRAPGALIDLIDDDDVSGHAISALCSLGPKRSLPYLVEARPKLEAVLTRETATDFAKRQARKALDRLAQR